MNIQDIADDIRYIIYCKTKKQAGDLIDHLDRLRLRKNSERVISKHDYFYEHWGEDTVQNSRYINICTGEPVNSGLVKKIYIAINFEDVDFSERRIESESDIDMLKRELNKANKRIDNLLFMFKNHYHYTSMDESRSTNPRL